jgi:hypothetical protein
MCTLLRSSCERCYARSVASMMRCSSPGNAAFNTSGVARARYDSSSRCPRGHTEAARAEAGLRGLSPAPSPTACRGQPKWDTFSKSRGQTVIAPPGWAVSLWSHRQAPPPRAGLEPCFIRVVRGGSGAITEDGPQSGALGLGQAGQGLHLTFVADLHPLR